MKKKLYCALLLSVYSILLSAHTADVLIYSYNRPLQLYALLESMERYMTGIGHTEVIYRVDSENFEKGYEIVKDRFRNAFFTKQGPNPITDFKQLTLNFFVHGTSSYILFAVDDNVVKEPVDLARCIEAIEQFQAYGFYLRLGTNITLCDSGRQSQPVPPLENVGGDFYLWKFKQAIHEWAYGHTLDMGLYRKKDVAPLLRQLPYKSPNTLEARWADAFNTNACGLCFSQSKMVNIPFNSVQKDWKNWSMEISVSGLLEIFMAGKKLDINPLYKFVHNSPHEPYEPTFVTR